MNLLQIIKINGSDIISLMFWQLYFVYLSTINIFDIFDRFFIFEKNK
jgi:hypothetical protein